MNNEKRDTIQRNNLLNGIKRFVLCDNPQLSWNRFYQKNTTDRQKKI